MKAEKVNPKNSLMVKCLHCKVELEYESDHYPDLFYLGEQWVHRHDCDEPSNPKGKLVEYSHCFNDYDDNNSELHNKTFIIQQPGNVPKCNNHCKKKDECEKLPVCPKCKQKRFMYVMIRCSCGYRFIPTKLNKSCPFCGRNFK